MVRHFFFCEFEMWNSLHMHSNKNKVHLNRNCLRMNTIVLHLIEVVIGSI